MVDVMARHKTYRNIIHCGEQINRFIRKKLPWRHVQMKRSILIKNEPRGGDRPEEEKSRACVHGQC